MATLRNYIEAASFTLIWIAAGGLLHLNSNDYLLLGVPLVVVFQLLVRQQPLCKLWVRDAQSFSISWRGVMLALGLLIVPVYDLATLAPTRNWSVILWLVCCLGGAVLVAFAGCRLQWDSITKSVVLSFATAVLMGCALMSITALAQGRSPSVSSFQVLPLLKQFYLYFLVCFTLEEVVFRGALDSHVYRTGDKRPWASAFFVSALWGLWHLPILPIPNLTALLTVAPAVVVMHALVGIPLSFCWRNGGTLLFPAAAQALMDAYRNAILG
ncbi:MAG: CPBP family intramembrane metalloprotease [Abitibacteriaceae bacterium]|nr:CPBP family intramembrane metalloprotease [Abditibacteriaceae bacterium]